MKQRRDFTYPEIDQLQKEIDTCSHLWIDLVGESGTTNMTGINKRVPFSNIEYIELATY
jgi:hypothetical protein